MRLHRDAVPPLYALTDDVEASLLTERLAELIAAGVRWIQIRSKNIPDDQLYRVVREAEGMMPAKVMLFVNDRVDVAVAASADGVHLGKHDLPPDAARMVAGDRELLIGCSTHSAEDAIAAAACEEVDYVALGPIFSSLTKNVREPLGLDELARARKGIGKPLIAIGGITAGNIGGIMQAGADSAAIIAAIYERGTIAENVRRLLEAMEKER
ncbi:MAG TPA: thiamine phosphate synthase [Thermoanaerobaculia bacterium]|nr:thiamine phosphate synthase [Thermoanaerobaculia bacterium]